MTDFAREVDSAVAGALNPGEQVVWTGHCLSRLGKQRKVGPTPLIMLLFVIPFLCISLTVWIHQLGNGLSGGLLGSTVFVAAGTLMGFSLIAGRRIDDAMYCRKQTVYVLTDQRAFVLKHCRTKVPMRSAAWRFVDDVCAEWVELDGRGVVKFRHWNPVARQWETPLQFYKVGNAHRVAEWARAAMMQANG